MNPPPQRRIWLLAVLGLAVTLRAGLALQGGQLFIGDEGRFMRSILLYRGLVTGEWALAGQALAAPQHAAFVLVGALLAPPAHALAWLAGTADWSRATEVHASLPLIALVTGGLSSLNVWLVHRAARAHGAEEDEALFSALLAAVAVSLLYQARHLLPYDAALAAALGGLWLAADARALPRQAACGACAGGCFALYNGYWFLVPVVGAALLMLQPDLRRRLRALAGFGIGAGAAFGLFMLPGTLLQGVEFWREFRHFSGTVHQGLFAEGWSFPWEYLWQTESWLGLVVLAAMMRAGLTGALPVRVRHWLVLAGLIYALLVLASTGLEKFVVYGRTVRPLTLLFCLLGGHALWCVMSGGGLRRSIGIALVLAAAAWNILPHFQISFPTQVWHAVWRDHGVPKLVLTYRGTMAEIPWPAVTRPDLALVDPVSLYPVSSAVPAPAGEVLARWRHPQSVAAYLYEAHRPRERRLLRDHPPETRLIRPEQADTLPDEPPRSFFGAAGDLPDGYDRNPLP